MSPPAVESMTIRNGYSALGGGILDSGGALSLLGVQVSNNTGTVTGGGIYNETGGQLTASLSTIQGNAEGMGGGIYNNGTITLTQTTVSGSNAGCWSHREGGGIRSSGAAYLTNVTISGNWAVSLRGGLTLSAGSAYLNNLTITDDTANTSADPGVGAGGLSRRGGLHQEHARRRKFRRL